MDKTCNPKESATIPKPFTTDSNSATIVFHSDDIESRKGFKMAWTSSRPAPSKLLHWIEIFLFIFFSLANIWGGDLGWLSQSLPKQLEQDLPYQCTLWSNHWTNLQEIFRWGRYKTIDGTGPVLQVLANSPMRTASCDIKMSVIYLLPLKYVKKMWQCSSERQSQALFVRCSFRSAQMFNQ